MQTRIQLSQISKGETMGKTSLFLAAVFFVGPIAFAGADFSGSWVLDPAKSDQMQMGRGGGGAPAEMTMTITMSPSEMTVSRTTARGPRETKYKLDGNENTSSTQGGELKYKAAWNGNSLTISGTRTTQRGERPIKEVYSLSDDGKVLTIASTRNGQQGETTTKQVFNKKQ
jgi:DNA-binding CsgD family transcriptional regulator